MKVVLALLALSLWATNTFGQTDGRARTHVFPQFVEGRFADGTFYRSAFVWVNPQSQSASCRFSLEGMTAVVQAADGSTYNIGSLPINGAANGGWDIFRTSGTQTLRTGYAVLECPIDVTAQVIYGYYAANGVKLSEATVFSSPAARSFQLISDQREGARLGFAIANDTDTAASVTISASSVINNAVVDVGFTVVNIAPRTNFVSFLDEVITGIPFNQIGPIVVTSSVPVSMIGLRFTGAAFTTIPATIRQN